ncbi:MAG: flavin reductase family protein [bacterium]|nr:flavin reductase family protein [bacterium]
MKNINIIRKITQGMYVLTTDRGGCIVDAVSQISAGENPYITVSVGKSNYTNELLKKNNQFAISILGTKVNPEIIKTFGFHSMKDIDKFQKTQTIEIEGIKVLKESLGYMVCQITNRIDNDTHTLFIGRIIEADVFEESEAMSYQYYQLHKEEILNPSIESEKPI